MKKLIFSLILVVVFISNVKAFSIDLDKIEITGKSDSLISNLDNSYSIETNGFEDEFVYDEAAKEVTKELVNISFSGESNENKLKNFSNYVYMSSDNGFQTLTSNVMIQNFVDNLDSYKIEYEYIKIIRTVKCSEGVLSFVYLDDVLVNGITKDMVVVYWLKNTDKGYKLYYPWFTINDDLEEYFNKVANNESNNEVIGGSYKNMSLTGNNEIISGDELNNLYTLNRDSNISITAIYNNGVSAYGSGFFIREGIVVTTWSLVLEFLTNSNYIYVNDSYGNTYKVEGLVSADTKYDIAVLKLNKEVGKKVTFGDSDNLSTDDKLFMINSKINTGFSISYGSYVESNTGRLSNLFAISSSDVGAAIYNKNGEVVGFNTSDILNSELSIANSTNYLEKLQGILINSNFSDIKCSKLESFKNDYYRYFSEEIISNVGEDVLDKFNGVGNFNENINLDLIKSSYKDNILSLRYKIKVSDSISSMYYVSNYIDELVKLGYENKLDNYDKKIYCSDKYQVIIKNNMNYVVILIMEI